MMKKGLWTLAAVLALAPAGQVRGHGDHKHDDHAAHGKTEAAAEKTTITGEVLDLACYLGHGGVGEKHMKCAKQCVLGGAPAGLLDAKGTLYLLVEDHAHPKPYGAMKKLAGEKAKITGRVVTKHGMQALVVMDATKGK